MQPLWKTVCAVLCTVALLCLTLCDPMTVARQALSMGFSRQEYWSGLPFPPPGDLPNPGTKPASSAAPTLAGGLPLSHLGIRGSFKQDTTTLFLVWQTLRGSLAAQSPADVSMEVSTEG